MKTNFIFLLLLIFLSSGCESYSVQQWISVSEDVDMRILDYTVDNLGGEIYVLRFQNSKFTPKIYYSETPKLISQWANDSEGIVLNGSYFNDSFLPSGLLIVKRRRVGDNHFDFDKSGLLAISDKSLNIFDLNDYSLDDLAIKYLDYALQSYPFLIKDQKMAVKEDSFKKSRRTAIGIDENNYVYLFLSDSVYLSLYEFMLEINKMNIQFTHVLNLDGGTSTGISVNIGNFNKTIDSLVPVPIVLYFEP